MSKRVEVALNIPGAERIVYAEMRRMPRIGEKIVYEGRTYPVLDIEHYALREGAGNALDDPKITLGLGVRQPW